MADRLPPVDLTHTARPKLPLQAALVAPDVTLAYGELPPATAALDHPGAAPAAAQTMQVDPPSSASK